MHPIAVTLPLPVAWPSLDLLRGHLAPTSLVKYQQAVAAYRAWCGSDAQALAPTSLARWRTHLVQHTPLHPDTINHRLAAVKRLIAEAAAQGYCDAATADAFARVRPLKPQTLLDRGRRLRRTRLLPAEMRRLCEAPAVDTLRGLRDRALLATLASSGCRVAEVVASCLPYGLLLFVPIAFFAPTIWTDHSFPNA